MVDERQRAILVNCFASSNEMRVEPIREVLRQKGYTTVYLSSDFHHAKKQYYQLPKDIRPIHVRSYSKNLSLDRLLSHYEFSRKVYKYLCRTNPDLIYIKFPPNSLVRSAFDYKKRNPECKVILDLFDLWPESLPIPAKAKKMLAPITNIWMSFRDKYIKCADLLLTECNMYQEVLKNKLPENTHTLYLTKPDIDYRYIKDNEDDQIRLCYLGGINNLIDLEAINNVLTKIKTKHDISIDIIGDGQNKDELIRIAGEAGAKVHFHGVVYDEQQKYEIMQHCDFGLNLMKDTSKVALTLKSIEYLRAGLALINNIPYDTMNLIEQDHCGINVKNINQSNLNRREVEKLKKNARAEYLKLFEYSACKKEIISILDSINV